jgi:hypothetical protein
VHVTGNSHHNDFSAQADTAQPGTMRELVYFLSHNKKWWITPIFVVLLLVGVFLILGSTAAAPFIYTLF